MKKVLFTFAILFCIGYSLVAQQMPADSLKHIQLEEVVVSATRAGQKTPIAYSNVSATQLKQTSAANNLPMILQTLPSLVAFTEGGTGVGNTSFRIRGTDATRINVTLNGMPLNNPESSEVYWVNLPDLSGSLQSVQLQRGVGTSSNGGSAFGASLSLQTAGARPHAYGEASTAVGSYNTFHSNIAAGTGILANGLSLDARYSRILSDGYIRNGFVNHNNLYLALSHYANRQLLRFVYLRGRQKTGITWEGVTEEQMKDKEYGRRYNPTGKYKDDAGNTLYYDDSDNYFSDIAQLIYTCNLTDYLDLNANLSYNYGFGYYENYKANQGLKKKFGFEPQLIKGVTHENSDVIRRKMMENHFYVGNVAINYHRGAWNVHSGAMYSFYDGNHFGKLPWVKYNQNISPDAKWYENSGKKQDITVFAKAEYTVNDKWSVFGDVQGRFIDYKFKGFDDNLITDLTRNYAYQFFNPKAGAYFRPNAAHAFYTSVSVGNREPLRADYKDAARFKRDIYPERMYDVELGYKFNKHNVHLGANLYYMLYDNQLVQTGRLNDSGYKIMENVKDSYRAGIELEASLPLVGDVLRFDATTTLSRNKIKAYTAHYSKNWSSDDYQSEEFKNTDISFSPSVTGSGVLNYQPLKNLGFRFTGIYVGKQFMDNTSDNKNSLDAYFVGNLSASYSFKPMAWGAIELDFFVNNLFNSEYIANGYGVKYIDEKGNVAVYQGFYPQATRNYMARLTVKF